MLKVTLPLSPRGQITVILNPIDTLHPINENTLHSISGNVQPDKQTVLDTLRLAVMSQSLQVVLSILALRGANRPTDIAVLSEVLQAAQLLDACDVESAIHQLNDYKKLATKQTTSYVRHNSSDTSQGQGMRQFGGIHPSKDASMGEVKSDGTGPSAFKTTHM